jgi:hypothetical protein
VLEERRHCLTSEMVEILTCLKDWQMGDDRIGQLGESRDSTSLRESVPRWDDDDNQDDQPVAAVA